jgi:hypothetical protein
MSHEGAGVVALDLDPAVSDLSSGNDAAVSPERPGTDANPGTRA